MLRRNDLWLIALLAACVSTARAESADTAAQARHQPRRAGGLEYRTAVRRCVSTVEGVGQSETRGTVG